MALLGQARSKADKGAQDYYALLGVTEDAAESEIKKAYRKMALQYHPDKQTSSGPEAEARAERHFKLISEAYAILSDATKRREYDGKRSARAWQRRDNKPADFGGFGRAGAFGGSDKNFDRQRTDAQRNPFARTGSQDFDWDAFSERGGFGRRARGAGGKW